jgi:hypothetical protein
MIEFTKEVPMRDAEFLTSEITEAELIQKLVDIGWNREMAEKEVKKTLESAEEEDED